MFRLLPVSLDSRCFSWSGGLSGARSVSVVYGHFRLSRVQAGVQTWVKLLSEPMPPPPPVAWDAGRAFQVGYLPRSSCDKVAAGIRKGKVLETLVLWGMGEQVS